MVVAVLARGVVVVEASLASGIQAEAVRPAVYLATVVSLNRDDDHATQQPKKETKSSEARKSNKDGIAKAAEMQMSTTVGQSG